MDTQKEEPDVNISKFELTHLHFRTLAILSFLHSSFHTCCDLITIQYTFSTVYTGPWARPARHVCSRCERRCWTIQEL